MLVRKSHVVRIFLLASLMSINPFPHRELTAATADDSADAMAQVRLRKLHLVRPDLIPYPISFEVYA
jgi:hypothetical protein